MLSGFLLDNKGLFLLTLFFFIGKHVFMIIHLSDIPTVRKQYFLQHLIAPRPIGFVSTINNHGQINLSPFSFFNLFSANPPVVIFSPSRRIRDNSLKHTLLNVTEVSEAVINLVTYDMVQQTSLASGEYPGGIDEFIKAGFTKEKATIVQPPMVKESPAKLECRVMNIQSLGNSGGAGQLVICEVQCLHINDALFDENKNFDPHKLDLVARLGDNWYSRVNAGLFAIEKPNYYLGMGMEQLPGFIKECSLLTNNHKAQLANTEIVPRKDPAYCDERLDAIHTYFKGERKIEILFAYCKELLEENKVAQAWQVLLSQAEIGVPA